MTGGRKDQGDGKDLPLTDEEALFAKLRDAAQEEEEEVASVPADFAPPLSGQERQAIATAALAALAPAHRGADVRSIPAASEPHRRRLRRWLWPTVLVPVAGLGALVLALRPATAPSSPLPAYNVDVRGGLRDMRGGSPPETGPSAATAPLQRVAPDTELVVIARPEVPVAGEVASRAFLIRADRGEEIAVQERVSPSGSVEIRVRPASGTDRSAGSALLRIVVGRPAAVRAAGARGDIDSPDARWLVVPLEFVGG